MGLVAALPGRTRRADEIALDVADLAREPLLDFAAQPIIARKLGHLRTPGPTLRMPLRDRRLVLEPGRPRRSVTAQLPRDRRRAPARPSGDLTHTVSLRP